MKRMQNFVFALALAAIAATATAQTAVHVADSLIFRGTLVNDEYQVWLEIDFTGQSVVVPGQELFGSMPGYLGARRDERKWFITSAEIVAPATARLVIINDYGSEDLTATLTRQADGSYLLRQADGSPLRIVVNRKWLKLPKTIQFKRKE